MSLIHYFLSPHGRIGRQAFWLGLTILMAVTIPVSLLLDPATFEAAKANPGGAINTVPSWASTLWSLALSWPSAANENEFML